MADEIWICENETVTKWDKDILAYKEHLKNKVLADLRKAEQKAAASGTAKAKGATATNGASKRGAW